MAKKKTKRASKPKAKKVAARKPGRPKAIVLPGMEDAVIQPLEDIAEAYADIRDQRMLLSQEEADLKATAIKVMRKHGKTIYRRNGITIQIIDGEVAVKVRVAKPKDIDAVDLTVGADTEAVEQVSDADDVDPALA